MDSHGDVNDIPQISLVDEADSAGKAKADLGSAHVPPPGQATGNITDLQDLSWCSMTPSSSVLMILPSMIPSPRRPLLRPETGQRLTLLNASESR